MPTKYIIILLSLISCTTAENQTVSDSNQQNTDLLYNDVSESNLPIEALSGLSMDAKPGDVDNDGDLDIVIANEHRPNILLINDGQGVFTDESAGRLPQKERDSEDVAIADFNDDGAPDIFIVSEDDTENELYLNDGTGHFEDASDRIPVEGTSNAVLSYDINGDDLADIIIGNNGQNQILINQGQAQWQVETAQRLPPLNDITQDIELGDVNGDGHLDLLVGNEDKNRLLINNGEGAFIDETDERLVFRDAPEETREADFGDIDNDGDLDILFANVRAFVSGADMKNRILLNNGNGRFNDETAVRLPEVMHRSFDGDLFDLDSDGDLDLIFSNTLLRSQSPTPYTVYTNNGNGVFSDKTGELLPASAQGFGFDAEFADFNGDNQNDLFLANRGSADILLLRR